MIEEFAKLIPSKLENESGAVFFSGRDAFSGLKDLYVLGLNPGGNPYERLDDTISKHTYEVLHKKRVRWSEYTCESWAPDKEPGKGRFQQNVIHLIQNLGYDPRDVPASNVIFLRSRGMKTLEPGDADRLFDDCWPLHREVISNVQPRLIVCVGKSFRDLLIDRTKSLEPIDSLTKSYGRSYRTEVFRNKRGCRLAFVWHLSWGPNLANGKSDPSGVVRQALEGAKVRWSSVDVR